MPLYFNNNYIIISVIVISDFFNAPVHQNFRYYYFIIGQNSTIFMLLKLVKFQQRTASSLNTRLVRNW